MPDDKRLGLFGRVKAAFMPPDPVDVGGGQTFTPVNATARDLGIIISDTGVSVNADAIMRLDAVAACVKLVSQAVAALPLTMYMRTQDGRKEAVNHPLYTLLLDGPNSNQTAFDFWQTVVTRLLLDGTAYVRKVLTDGRIESLQYLANDRLTITTDTKGNTAYRYRRTDGQMIDIPRQQIWKIMGYSLDGENGLSAIRYGAQIFGTAIAAEAQAARAFRNGQLQSVYYQIDRFLTDDQYDSFAKKVSGSVEAGRAPLLEGGMDVKSLGLNPVDAQLLQSRQYSVESICRFFGVPPSMIGHSSAGTTSWGSGIESQQLGFLSMTLSPWLRRIEQSIALNLLSPAERRRYFADFDTSALLRADSAARSSYYSQLVNNGLMTRDEAREIEGLPKLGGNAAVLTVQSAMVPLDSIGLQTSPEPASGLGNQQQDKASK
ncbi:portal protein [Xanthomonas oryzae]|uniref:phage portal protein n=1 Tax=Xanthomonas oryzae TaxID=347 RepID=UPI0006AC8CF9|nr:phage portal protein [Xanthomonas oryzae]KOR46431.1 portal protein [Xanthomonas oryzae]